MFTPPGGWDVPGWSLHCLAGSAVAASVAVTHGPWWVAIFVALFAGCVHEQAQSHTVIRWAFEPARLIDILAFLPGAIVLAVLA